MACCEALPFLESNLTVDLRQQYGKAMGKADRKVSQPVFVPSDWKGDRGTCVSPVLNLESFTWPRH